MSLKVYTRKTGIPSGVEYVDYNDVYFNGEVLVNNDITKRILKDIDKAEFNSENTVLGRDRDLGALNKNCLSTGCKTLLNILYNPNVCFDVIECGSNALKELSKIDNGIIYWDTPVLALIYDIECDIEYDNKKFTSYLDFLNYVGISFT